MNGEPTADIARARELGIETCGRIATFWGFAPTMGRTFGLLYLSSEPLTQAEVARRLGISAGNASMTLRALEGWGVVHKVWMAGARRDRYQAETDFWKMISAVLNERERREIGAAVAAVGQAEALVRGARATSRGATRVDADFAHDRLQRLNAVCRLGETMLDMLLGDLRLDVGRFRDVLRAGRVLGVGADRRVRR